MIYLTNLKIGLTKIADIMFIDYSFHMACFYSRQKAIYSVNNRPVLAKICDKLSKYYYKQAGWA